MLLIHNIRTTPVSHVLKYILQLKHSVVNQIHFILHNIQIFLLHTLMVSGKKVLDKSNNNFVFPALNVSNNFATIDYDAHINTKINYTIFHVFCSMTVQEPNTFHTIWELEENSTFFNTRNVSTKPSTCWFPFNRKL